MADEIERRFLVHPSKFAEAVRGCGDIIGIMQAYLGTPGTSMHVQIVGFQEAFLTFSGSVRRYAYLIPIEKAHEIFSVIPDEKISGRAGVITPDDMTMRVRLENGARGMLTFKGKQKGISCPEIEFEIPLEDAVEILHNDAVWMVLKTRSKVPVARHTFEVDAFHGIIDGLFIAEVELGAEAEAVTIPSWCGPEISTLFDFKNVKLGQLTAADVPALRKRIDELFAKHGAAGVALPPVRKAFNPGEELAAMREMMADPAYQARLAQKWKDRDAARAAFIASDVFRRMRESLLNAPALAGFDNEEMSYFENELKVRLGWDFVTTEDLLSFVDIVGNPDAGTITPGSMTEVPDSMFGAVTFENFGLQVYWVSGQGTFISISNGKPAVAPFPASA